jgi:hypothetical protein
MEHAARERVRREEERKPGFKLTPCRLAYQMHLVAVFKNLDVEEHWYVDGRSRMLRVPYVIGGQARTMRNSIELF